MMAGKTNAVEMLCSEVLLCRDYFDAYFGVVRLGIFAHESDRSAGE
jgi:hypothetical protein